MKEFALAINELDPLTDRRWPEFVNSHPESSIFHTREWLASLHSTYRYQPIAFTTSNLSQLDHALVFCKIKSSFTGSRLVSLPFSDHCQPLADAEQTKEIIDILQAGSRAQSLKYIEFRPLKVDTSHRSSAIFDAKKFRYQAIDLRKESNVLYKNLHESCIRRKIKRAEKEGLVYEEGSSEQLLQDFRELFLLTRRRHELPPPPRVWSLNLAHFFGERLKIHVVRKDSIPVASILTITHKETIVYKYGCSNASYSHMGGTPYLFWKVIQQAKAVGLVEFDLGRSDYDDSGLITFKEHLGAKTDDLIYLRNTPPKAATSLPSALASFVRPLFSRLPNPVFEGVGNLLYRHMG